jgi:hypothetical protein
VRLGAPSAGALTPRAPRLPHRRTQSDLIRRIGIYSSSGRGGDRNHAVTQRDTPILESRTQYTWRITSRLRRAVTAYAGTRSTESGRGAARYAAQADDTTVVAPCDLTQKQPPIVVAQDIDLVGCSPEYVVTRAVSGSSTQGKRAPRRGGCRIHGGEISPLPRGGTRQP